MRNDKFKELREELLESSKCACPLAVAASLLNHQCSNIDKTGHEEPYLCAIFSLLGSAWARTRC